MNLNVSIFLSFLVILLFTSCYSEETDTYFDIQNSTIEAELRHVDASTLCCEATCPRGSCKVYGTSCDCTCIRGIPSCTRRGSRITVNSDQLASYDDLSEFLGLLQVSGALEAKANIDAMKGLFVSNNNVLDTEDLISTTCSLFKTLCLR